MTEGLNVPIMAELMAQGKQPDILFWVGSAGSYDHRAKKITRAFVKILNKAQVNFAVLGIEESTTGDLAKRAGNEFLFQMQAMTNIEVLNAYGVKRIVTACPHSYNTLKNEYPELGGHYHVQHHSQFINELIQSGQLTVTPGQLNNKRITFHDPCYLGRANNEYEAPRNVLKTLGGELVEMKRHKATALCCGAGGAQMFKEPEKGNKDINVLRTEDALQTKPNIIATGCPYCNTMMTDGIKAKEKETEIEILDIAELIAQSLNL
ncbi:MAG: (Fe-S)-binding protein [Flavobacteriaceae bacterium]